MDVFAQGGEEDDDAGFTIDGFSAVTEDSDEEDDGKKKEKKETLLDHMKQVNCDMALIENYCEIDLLTKQFTNL